jgi:hypothetical protein
MIGIIGYNRSINILQLHALGDNFKFAHSDFNLLVSFPVLCNSVKNNSSLDNKRFCIYLDYSNP